MRPRAATARRWAGGKLPLVALSLYGVADGDASQGLEAGAAALWVDSRDGAVRLQSGIGLNPVDPNASVAQGLEGMDGRAWSKVSLAPDQNSRRVIAWTENGVCTVSRLVPNGATLEERRDSWTGFDCLLFLDAWLGDAASGEASDVIAFYLSADRLTLHYRVQSANFATEHTYAALLEPVSLDAVARTNGGRSLGVFLSRRGGSTLAVQSAPYPVRVGDAAQLALALASGNLETVILELEPLGDAAQIGLALAGGAIADVPRITLEVVADAAQLALVLHAATLATVVLGLEPLGDAAQIGLALQAGNAPIATVDGGTYNESMELGLALAGGAIT
jgi:hypothetical protein